MNGIDVYGADDEVLKAIGEKLTGITYLRIIGPDVTDDGLACLRRLKNLQTLHLIDTSVSGTGLYHLHGSSWLQSLKIASSKMTDDGVAELVGFQNLVHVGLDLNDQLTKVSADHLGQVKSLTWVDLYGTGIPEDEVAELWIRLPKLRYLNGFRRPSGSSNASSDQAPAKTVSASAGSPRP